RRIFASPGALKEFLDLPLTGANALLQRTVKEITGGRYPFPSPDPLGTAFASKVRRRRTTVSVRAVIVNFHRYDLVDACVRALDSAEFPPNEIVVVDNESEPDQLQRLAADHPSVRMIANADNAGYARACNQGAAGASTDFVLFINPDVTVSPSALDRCVVAA